MICVVIKGPSIEEAYLQISAALAHADIVELRLDLLHCPTVSQIEYLRNAFTIPMIFTLRSQQQGGNYEGSEEQRTEEILSFAALEPIYIDLEDIVPVSFIEKIQRAYPEIKIILSHHDFESQPFDLGELYKKITQMPAHFYKVALTLKNTLEALHLLNWAKQYSGKIIAIGMGDCGQITRVLAPIFGSVITYAALDNTQLTAPGQLPAKTLVEQYHYRSLSPLSALYGLIGDPVVQSVSDVSHNKLMQALGLDAVYTKMHVREEELAAFIPMAKQMGFKGLSVTMPLKEKIMPFLDQIDPIAQKMGAVNTLHFKEEEVIGYNTDGAGALDVIEKHTKVQGKRMIIVGAGGAARAIAYEAQQRGAEVIIVNQNVEKAFNMAKNIRAHLQALNEMSQLAKEGYDLLINCTPNPMPISAEHIRKEALVMDIVTKPKNTLFIETALKKGCAVVYGYEMFIEQALGQFKIWFEESFAIEHARKILVENVTRSLE